MLTCCELTSFSIALLGYYLFIYVMISKNVFISTVFWFLFAGSPYYDNVRPLSYPDADAVLICFDIGRPETLENVLRKVR